MKMNWGARIVLSFIVFFMIIISMVVIAMRQDINLVEEDYYNQEVKYQEQIERIRNTNELKEQPQISFNKSSSSLEILFPSDFSPGSVSGELLFFRPSNADMDVVAELKLDSKGKQALIIPNPEKGYWKAKLSWKSGSKEYYQEKVIIL